MEQVIDRDGVAASPEWRQYFQTIYVAACIATWQFCLHLAHEETGDLPDPLQVYQNIRDAPEQLYPNRPAVDQVPVPAGGVWHEGRRGLRASDFGGLQQEAPRAWN